MSSTSALLDLPALSPAVVASHCLTSGSPAATSTQLSQTSHRIDIVRSWLYTDAADGEGALDDALLVGPTARILDIGCGQGDMTALLGALCAAQGAQSSVVGLDPAPTDYGSPYTLGDAQTHLRSSPVVGPHLSFVQSTAPEHLAGGSASASASYSAATLVHSLYYFPTAASLQHTFSSLRARGVRRLLLAEWALSGPPAALPHLLAVLLQSVAPLPEGNVRTVLAPSALTALARAAGWRLVRERTFAPQEHVDDGRWEVGFARGIAKRVTSEWEHSLRVGGEEGQWPADEGRSAEGVQAESVRAHAGALESALAGLEGGAKGVRAMDVWTGVFEPAEEEAGQAQA